MQRPEKRAGCFAVLMSLLYVVPKEESWVFLCDNVCFVQCRGERAGCFCVMMYVFCAVPLEESWVFSCDDVGILCSAMGRELNVFV